MIARRRVGVVPVRSCCPALPVARGRALRTRSAWAACVRRQRAVILSTLYCCCRCQLFFDQIAEIARYPLEGVAVEMREDSVGKWDVFLEGPRGTPLYVSLVVAVLGGLTWCLRSTVSQ